MSVAAFTTAHSLDDALAALAAGARPVAGGTDLVVAARSGKAPLPESIVAIHRVAELHGIEVGADGGLRLGALASHAEIAAHREVRARFTALSDACAIVGSHATRAQGTIGGNLMNASPAMETGGPLVCLGAVVMLQSGSEPREVAVEDLWTGPGGTVAREDELLVDVRVPAPAPGTGQRVHPARVPPPDGDRDRRRHGGRDARRRHRHGRPYCDDGALADDPARARGRGGARGQRRRRGGRSSRRPPRSARLPAPSPTSAARPTTGARWPR